MEHTRIETAEHFRISYSRAEIQEKKSLSTIRHELWVVIPEKRFAAAEDTLTKLLVFEGELHAVELRFDLIKGEAEIIVLADNDAIKSRKFAVRAMECINTLRHGDPPERITLTFV